MIFTVTNQTKNEKFDLIIEISRFKKNSQNMKNQLRLLFAMNNMQNKDNIKCTRAIKNLFISHNMLRS